EEVNSVASVVPQQVVGPAAHAASGVEVGAAEEVGLHVHLQHFQFASFDLLVNPLMAWVEAAGVTSHGNQLLALCSHFLLRSEDGFGLVQSVGHPDFTLYVLACFQTLDGLRSVHLSSGSDDHCVYIEFLETLAEIGAPLFDAASFGSFAGG